MQISFPTTVFIVAPYSYFYELENCPCHTDIYKWHNPGKYSNIHNPPYIILSFASAMRREVDVHTFSHLNDMQTCDSSPVCLFDKHCITHVWGRMQHIYTQNMDAKALKDVAR